jgi:hypothetical protein
LRLRTAGLRAARRLGTSRFRALRALRARACSGRRGAGRTGRSGARLGSRWSGAGLRAMRTPTGLRAGRSAPGLSFGPCPGLAGSPLACTLLRGGGATFWRLRKPQGGDLVRKRSLRLLDEKGRQDSAGEKDEGPGGVHETRSGL